MQLKFSFKVDINKDKEIYFDEYKYEIFEFLESAVSDYVSNKLNYIATQNTIINWVFFDYVNIDCVIDHFYSNGAILVVNCDIISDKYMKLYNIDPTQYKEAENEIYDTLNLYFCIKTKNYAVILDEDKKVNDELYIHAGANINIER